MLITKNPTTYHKNNNPTTHSTTPTHNQHPTPSTYHKINNPTNNAITHTNNMVNKNVPCGDPKNSHEISSLAETQKISTEKPSLAEGQKNSSQPTQTLLE